MSETSVCFDACAPRAVARGVVSRLTYRVGLSLCLLVFSALPVHAQLIRSIEAFDQAHQTVDDSRAWIIALSVPNSTASADHGWENLNDYIGRVQHELADEMGWRNFNELVAYEHLPLMAKQLDRSEAERVLASPHVAGLYRNEMRFTSLKESTRMTHEAALLQNGNRGAGQVVAVIDTGVDDTHPFLRGKVVGGACFSFVGNCAGGMQRDAGPQAGRPTIADAAHGTHVAGIIVGSDSNSHGMAPDANVLAVQVFSRVGDQVGATDADILAGLDWVYSQRERFSIVAVNLSLGAGEFTAACDGITPFTQAFRLLRQAGIVPVVASGNESLTSAIGSPACVSLAVSVGSLDKDGSVSRFSNSSAQLSLVAPGGSIRSSVPGGQFHSFSGTSMAAPHVAGAIALLKSAHPQASADDIVRALTQGGRLIQDSRNHQTTPQLDVAAADQRLSGATPTPAPAPKPEAAPAPKPPPVSAPSPTPTPIPAKPPAPAPKPSPRPTTPKPVAPKPVAPDINLPLCEERVGGILVQRAAPCRKGG